MYIGYKFIKKMYKIDWTGWTQRNKYKHIAGYALMNAKLCQHGSHEMPWLWSPGLALQKLLKSRDEEGRGRLHLAFIWGDVLLPSSITQCVQ